MDVTWTGGPTSFDGINANYWRLSSAEKVTPPYVWSGSFKLNAVMQPPVFGYGWRTGQTATWDPGINFMCMYPSNDRNVLIGIGRRSNPTGVGISAEMRDVRPNQPYGVRTGYVSRVRNNLEADPADGRWHTFVVEVDSVDKYRLFVDGRLVADVVEKLPATIDPGPVSVGLRLDFCDVELGPMRLEEGGDDMVFVPHGAPAGVDIRWLDRPNPSGFPLWATRPAIKPRLVLLHTNGASRPGSIDAAYNWANQYNDNTKPHYQVQRDGSAAKFLPSDRKGIGNYKVADFSLVIETQDLGYGPGMPGEAAGYTDAQRATIARIVAYESLTHGIPLVVPKSWSGHGIGSHTDPFGYPYWTNSPGKVCPGAAKKADLQRIIAEAERIALAWTHPPTDDEDDMAYLAIPPSERAGKPWLYVSSGVRPATTFDVNDGVEKRDMNTIPKAYRVQQYDDLHRAAGLG